jgi:hypothetical protein
MRYKVTVEGLLPRQYDAVNPEKALRLAMRFVTRYNKGRPTLVLITDGSSHYYANIYWEKRISDERNGRRDIAFEPIVGYPIEFQPIKATPTGDIGRKVERYDYLTIGKKLLSPTDLWKHNYDVEAAGVGRNVPWRFLKSDELIIAVRDCVDQNCFFSKEIPAC